MIGAGPRTTGRKARVVAGLLGAALAVAVAGVRFSAGAGGPADIDEVYWIGSAYYFDLASRGRVWHEDWALLPARENPPVGKYLVGAALAAGGLRVPAPDRLAAFYLHFAEVPGAWGGVASIAKRRAVVDRVEVDRLAALVRLGTAAVSGPELRLGRAVTVAAGMAAVAGVVALGWLASGPATGTLAGLLLAVHPLMFLSAGRVSVDTPALAFSVAAMLALCVLLRSAGRGRTWAAGGALGVALALACGTKMNATVVLLTALVAWAALLVTPGPRWRRPKRAATAGLVLSGLVFVAINPALYPEPIGGAVALIEESAINTAIQDGFLEGALGSTADRLRALAELVCRRAWLAPPFVALAVVQTVRAARSGRPGMVVVCLWWWVAFGMVGAWLPFAWPRYALPLVPPTALLAASAIVEIGRGLRATAGARVSGGSSSSGASAAP